MLLIVLGMLLKQRRPSMNNIQISQNQEYLEYTDTRYCWYNQDECKVLVLFVEKPWLI